ncbi:MAG: VOC family protein [SAR324 cluster bacterium]|nr:VOC family protein [SAR324 cluster bacterium]
MFQILQLDHVVLRVSDREKMIHFYTQALGCEIVRSSESGGITMMRAGRSMIDLLVFEENNQPEDLSQTKESRNMDHFCLRIEPFDEIEICKHLSQFGVTPSPAKTRLGAEGEGLSMYLEDPEGNTIELKGPSS